MIDTDKYEGLIDAEGYIDYDGLDHLLTEVKRLREGIEEMAEYMVAYHEVFPRIKDMAKELKELIE